MSRFVDVLMKQFTDNVVIEAILYSMDVSDKYTRWVIFLAREVVALNPYLGQKAYYFKRILEKDEQVTDLKQHIHRSFLNWDGKSCCKQLQDLKIGLNSNTLEFLNIHWVLRAPRLLDLVCIFGSPQRPNAININQSLFSVAVDGVMEIKRR